MSSSNASPERLRIAVVGGGIAGLTAAIAISKARDRGANVQLDVYEAAHKFAEIGAGVAFGPNAIRALHMLGLGDVLEAVQGDPGDDINIWFHFRIGQEGHPNGHKDFETLHGKDAAKGSVHRADFLDQLIDRLPKGIAHFHHRAISYETDASGITLHFENGSSAKADVVIASDGIKSQMRGALFEKNKLDLAKQHAVYSDWIAWRGIVPQEKYEEAMGKDAPTELMHLGLDRHILNFPVRKGEFVNIVAFVRDVDHAKLGGHTGPWSEDRPKSEMLEDFKHFNERCLTLLKEIENPSIWGIFDLPEIETFIDERIALIGDAAHATTPHQGAGAGQAVEDALFISSLLTDPSTCSAPLQSRAQAIQRALAAFQDARHERSTKVQRTSREAGLLYEFRGVGGEGDDVSKIGKSLEGRMGWIWEWDTEAELERALKSLK